ncbi:MAG: phosphatase PAP2 family protein [Acidobacteriaceae bacterium]
MARGRHRTEQLLLTTIFGYPALAVAEFLPQILMNYVMSHRTTRYDLYLYKTDGWFGFPDFVLGRWIANHHLLTRLAADIYAAPALIFIGVFATYICLCNREKWVVLKLLVLGLLIEIPIYFIIPVSGPKYAFKNFPQNPGVVVPHTITLTDPANGIPSLHTSMAIWIAALLWRWPWGRVFGIVFLLLTVLTILANGEHYFLDIVSAVPYSWAVWRLVHGRGFAPAQELVQSDAGLSKEVAS